MAASRVAALCTLSSDESARVLARSVDAVVPVTAACRLGVAASMVGAFFGSWARVALRSALRA